MNDHSPAFDSFGLDPRIVEEVGILGFSTPTPIQTHAMPPMLEGRDLIGRARTGSGKTAAFGLPMLERIKEKKGNHVRALVLAPTRELALQVTEALRSYAKKLPVRIVTVYGGAPYGPQFTALRKGVPLVVGTPGRVLDHMKRGTLDLSKLEMLVLDEADEMLKMGFIDDVTKVLEASPEGRQVVLFSATMPEEIRKVATAHLREPLEVQVEQRSLSVEHISQRWMEVPQFHKVDALVRILASEPVDAALVFARTRAGCAEVADHLAERGVEVDALHGDLNQAARERVLGRLRSGRLRVVIATDVAARGLDVEHLTHVINYDLPASLEDYVHRIGRTGRAGRRGTAISLATSRDQNRIRSWQRSLEVAIDPMEVPSDLVIRRARVAKLTQALSEQQTEAGASAGVDGLITDLEKNGSYQDIARAAITLLAQMRDLDLEEDADWRPPRWAKGKPQRRRGERSDRGGERDGRGPARPQRSFPEREEIDLFLPLGASRGVRPSDLVGAIANDTGIEGSTIGRITILPHKSFVRMAKEAAEHVLRKHAEIELRGHQVRISKARPQGDATVDGHLPRGGPAERGGFRAPKKRWNKKR